MSNEGTELTGRGLGPKAPGRTQLLCSTPDPRCRWPQGIGPLPRASWRQLHQTKGLLIALESRHRSVSRIQRAERLAWQSAAPKIRGAARARPVTCCKNWVDSVLGNPTRKTSSPAQQHNFEVGNLLQSSTEAMAGCLWEATPQSVFKASLHRRTTSQREYPELSRQCHLWPRTYLPVGR